METLKGKIITYIFRHKVPQNSSIEELFHSIRISIIERGYTSHFSEMPQTGASFKIIFQNLKYARTLNSSIFHITGDIHYIAMSLKGPKVLTIHDIGSALKGHFLKRFIVKLLWFWIPALLVNKITVISNSSKNELEKLIPFSKKKIQVIYNPVNPRIKKNIEKTFRKAPVILHIGTKANKNLERTIKALEGIDCKFVIIGRLTEKQSSLLKGCQIDYINEYYIPYDRIIYHYINCDIVSFVSTYEGFGMPIIEAQKVGRAVITSNVSSMPEIAGDGACLVDPFDVENMRSKIKKVIVDKDYRKNLIDKGFENVKRFDIDTITNQYLQLYSELLNK